MNSTIDGAYRGRGTNVGWYVIGDQSTQFSQKTDQSCDTQVHTPPLDNASKENDSLRSICQAVIYFKNVFAPKHRREKAWAKSFREDFSDFKGEGDGKCLTLIVQHTYPEHMAKLMNPEADRSYAGIFRNLICGDEMIRTSARTGRPCDRSLSALDAACDLTVSFARMHVWRHR